MHHCTPLYELLAQFPKEITISAYGGIADTICG